MVMYAVISLVFVFFAGPSVFGSQLKDSDNFYCKPYPTVVAVNQEGLPYYVVLNRCKGSIQAFSPKVKVCKKEKSTVVEVRITDARAGSGNVIKMENHTSCVPVCVYHDACTPDKFHRNSSDCSCRCKFDQAPSGCPANMRWDREKCACVCNLNEDDAPRRMILDKKKCQFVCDCSSDTVPDRRCRCRPKVERASKEEGSGSGIEGKALAALLVGEFVFLYLVFDFLLYSKKTGLMYYIKCKCSSNVNEEAQGETETKSCLEHRNELNKDHVTVAVDNNGCSKVNPPPQQVALHMSSI